MKTKFTPMFLRVGLVMIFTLTLHLLRAGHDAEWPFMLNCPPNVTISCTDNIYNLSQYGNATYTTYYGTFSAGNPTVHYYLNNCNTGYITRTWMVEWNWVWYNCTQTITVSSGGYYGNNPIIYWPEDYEIGGCNPNIHPNALPLPHRFPTWTAGPCSMLGRSYSDMVFYVNNSCRKVRRMWKVIDWCTYNANNPAAGGIWTYTQEIKIMDTQEPEVQCIPEIVANSFNCKDAFVNAANLVVDTSRCGGEFEITNNSPYSTSKGANISGVYPIGTTKVAYTIRFGCGFKKVCYTNVVVKNAAKPTPYCLGHIITTLMPMDTDHDGKADAGMVELWAKDLDRGSKAMCGFNPLRFSFTPDPTVMNRTFTCNDVGRNHVYVYVTDSKGNQSSCLTIVEIQNNANIPNCFPPSPPPPPDPEDDDEDVQTEDIHIAGKVTNAFGDPVSEVSLSLESAQKEITVTTRVDTVSITRLDSFQNASGFWVFRYMIEKKVVEKSDTTYKDIKLESSTNAEGVYVLDNNEKKITAGILKAYVPEKDPTEEVNARDVEALTKFLLGQSSFESPYQYLAADLNEDGKVDTEDLSALIKFVTSKAEGLPGNHKSYIISAGQKFDTPSDILTAELSATVNLDSIKTALKGMDFVLVRKGDIVKANPDNLISELTYRSASIEKDAEYSITPNPVADMFTLTVQAQYKHNIQIQYFDATGRMLRTMSLPAVEGTNQYAVSVADFNPGLILYAIWYNGKKVTGRLIKI